jgi:hypothetical protein
MINLRGHRRSRLLEDQAQPTRPHITDAWTAHYGIVRPSALWEPCSSIGLPASKRPWVDNAIVTAATVAWHYHRPCFLRARANDRRRRLFAEADYVGCIEADTTLPLSGEGVLAPCNG